MINQPALTIFTSRDAAQANKPHDANAQRLIEVFKRNPSRYAGVWLPTANIPNTDGVPTQYRAIVDAAIMRAAQGIIDNHAFSGAYEPSWIPADKLTIDAILTATQQTGTTWLSKEDVAQGWEASHTYKAFKAKMLALDPARRKAYGTALAAFSEAINKLSAKSVKSISPEQAQTMLAKLDDRDLTGQWGEFIAARLGTIANRQEPEAFDLDSL